MGGVVILVILHIKDFSSLRPLVQSRISGHLGDFKKLHSDGNHRTVPRLSHQRKNPNLGFCPKSVKGENVYQPENDRFFCKCDGLLMDGANHTEKLMGNREFW